jgi:hypothetical protein
MGDGHCESFSQKNVTPSREGGHDGVASSAVDKDSRIGQIRVADKPHSGSGTDTGVL